MELLTLWPLSQGEIERRREGFVDALFSPAWNLESITGQPERDLVGRVLRGGYPELCTTRAPSRRGAWFDAYTSSIIQRDIRELANIEGLVEIPRLLALLATRAAGLANYSEIARDLGIPQTTLKRYLALLRMTFLVQTIPAWYANLGQRLVKSPKLYLCDSGLLAHLLKVTPESMQMDRKRFGQVLENFVVLELRKQCAWSEGRPEIFHLRVHQREEVDIILEDRAGRLVGIEVKAGATLGPDDFKGLRWLAGIGKRFMRGVILYLGKRSVTIGPGLHAVPLNALWDVRAD